MHCAQQKNGLRAVFLYPTHPPCIIWKNCDELRLRRQVEQKTAFWPFFVSFNKKTSGFDMRVQIIKRLLHGIDFFGFFFWDFRLELIF